MGYTTKSECMKFNREVIPAIEKLGNDRFYDLFFQEIIYYDEKKKKLVNKFWCMDERIKEGLVKRDEFWDMASKYYEGNDAGVLIEYMIKTKGDIEFKQPEVLKKAMYDYLFENDFTESEVVNYLKNKTGIKDVDPVDVFSEHYNVEKKELEEILNSYGMTDNDEKIDFLRVYFVDPRLSPRGKLDPTVTRKILQERGVIKKEYDNLVHLNKNGEDYIIFDSDLEFKKVKVIHEDEESIIYNHLSQVYINGLKVDMWQASKFDLNGVLYSGEDIAYLEIEGKFHRVKAMEKDNIAVFLFNNNLYLIKRGDKFLRKIDSGNLELIGLTKDNEVVYLKNKKRKTLLRIYYPYSKDRDTVDKWKDKREVWIERKDYDDWIGVKGDNEEYYITRDGKLEIKTRIERSKSIKKTIGDIVKSKEIVYKANGKTYLIKKVDGGYGIYVRGKHNEKSISGLYDKVEYLGNEGNLLKFKVERNGDTLIKKITLSGYGRPKRAHNEEKVIEELESIAKLVEDEGEEEIKRELEGIEKIVISNSKYLDDILEKKGELTVYEIGNRKYLIKKKKDKYRILMRIGNKEKELTNYYDKIIFDKKYDGVLIFELYDEKIGVILTKEITLPKINHISSKYDPGALELCYFLSLPKNEEGYKEALKTREIRITYRGLKYIPKSVGRLKNLEDLDLRWNQISEIPKEIGKLKNLEKLYLNSNQISEIPKEVRELKNLEELGLRENQISEIPKEIGKLKNLKGLDLGSNQISEIPKEIGKLKNLEKLYLNSNQISEIPKEIMELKNLSWLYLNSNQISEIPKEVRELKNLEKLYLGSNQISEIPKEVRELKNLEELGLNNNPLSNEAKKFLEELKKKGIKVYY